MQLSASKTWTLLPITVPAKIWPTVTQFGESSAVVYGGMVGLSITTLLTDRTNVTITAQDKQNLMYIVQRVYENGTQANL